MRKIFALTQCVTVVMTGTSVRKAQKLMRMFPASLMFLGAVASTGEASPPIWFPTGFHLSASHYQDVLRKTLIPWMKELAEKHKKDFIFQQNDVPAHTAQSTQACLRELASISGRRTCGRHHSLISTPLIFLSGGTSRA